MIKAWAAPRFGTRTLFRAAAMALATVIAAPADADEGAAKKLFEDGAKAFARGDFVVAAKAFEGAYREAPSGAALENAGLAWEAAGDGPRAADAFAAALAAGGIGPAAAKEASTHLAALERKLGKIHVTAPPNAKIRVEHVDGAPAPIDVHLIPGDHEVRAQLEDDTAIGKHVHVAVGETQAIELRRDEAGSARESGADEARAKSGSSTDGGVSWRTVGFVGIGGGALLAGTAIALGVEGLSTVNNYKNMGSSDRSLHDRAIALRSWTNVAWVGAGVVGITGVVLVIVAPGSKATTAARLGPARVDIETRF